MIEPMEKYRVLSRQPSVAWIKAIFSKQTGLSGRLLGRDAPDSDSENL